MMGIGGGKGGERSGRERPEEEGGKWGGGGKN